MSIHSIEKILDCGNNQSTIDEKFRYKMQNTNCKDCQYCERKYHVHVIVLQDENRRLQEKLAKHKEKLNELNGIKVSL